MPNKPYTCPRCGYTTSNCGDMKRHLYHKKKVCPGQHDDIELTDEIKEIVMKNRVYVIKRCEKKTSTIINNYNNVNNFIAGMDMFEKLDKYIKYSNLELIGFEQNVEEKYSKNANRLENDAWKYGFALNKDDLLDVIDQVSKVNLSKEKVKTFEDLNIYYDKDAEKLKIFDGEWEEMLLNKGVKKILQTIQFYYWDSYERFLFKKLHQNTNPFNKQRLKELLVEYYNFIGCFDVEPFIKDKNDNELLGNMTSESAFSICDEYYPLYLKTRDNIKKSEINNVKKSVLDIIRKNSDRNVSELNKRIFDMFNIDESFKQNVVPMLVSGSYCI
jgi:hypothetical protein